MTYSDMQEETTPAAESLSDRELEILKLVATGASNKEIAQQLYISPNTVKVHLRHIFGKIGASSRTEASMIAIQGGLLSLSANISDDLTDNEKSIGMSVISIEDNMESSSPILSEQNNQKPRSNVVAYLIIGLLLLTTLLMSGYQFLDDPNPNLSTQDSQSAPTIPVPEAQQWHFEPSLHTPRMFAAVTTYRGDFYVIGGESISSNPLSSVEIYDPIESSWSIGNGKPTPTTKAKAVTIGGLIYIPGGETNNRKAENILEIYDPETDSWSTGKSLPYPVSTYAIAAYEGKMYVIGGWNGTNYLDSILEFNPETDEWEIVANLPEARGFAEATISEDGIIIIGGKNEYGYLSNVIRFFPPQSNATSKPTWGELPPLPEPRAHFGLTSTSSILIVIGGRNDQKEALPSLIHFPNSDRWQELPLPVQAWTDMGVAIRQTILYAFGGAYDGIPQDLVLRYQVLYTVAIPYVR